MELPTTNEPYVSDANARVSARGGRFPTCCEIPDLQVRSATIIEKTTCRTIGRDRNKGSPSVWEQGIYALAGGHHIRGARLETYSSYIDHAG